MTFWNRLKRKWTEHRIQDPTGFSFFCYCIKYCFIKSTRTVHGKAYALMTLPRLNSDKLNIAVMITGGLGDAIIHRRFIEQIAAKCPGADFLIFCPVPKQGKWVFGNLPFVKVVLPLELFDSYTEKYTDLSFYLNTFVFFHEQNVEWEKIRQHAPALVDMFCINRKRRNEWNIFIDNHPVLDGAFSNQALAREFNRYTFIPYMLGIDPPPVGLDLSMDMKYTEKIREKFSRYVTINTGFDAFFIIAGSTATKCYPTEHWTKLVSLLKEKYPSLGIVQVGNKNSPHIVGTDFDLTGKTTLEECAGILKHSTLHFDIEGGLVHVCASIGTRCVTLFGPTSIEYFSYPQNINLRNSLCPACWWSTERWMECCPRKYPRPECMYRLMPEKVLAAASPVLDEAGR